MAQWVVSDHRVRKFLSADEMLVQFENAAFNAACPSSVDGQCVFYLNYFSVFMTLCAETIIDIINYYINYYTTPHT
jgi:hypothetical protein